MPPLYNMSLASVVFGIATERKHKERTTKPDVKSTELKFHALKRFSKSFMVVTNALFCPLTKWQ